MTSPNTDDGGEAVHTGQLRAAPLSFASSGGDIIWQTYPGHCRLSIEEAEAVAALVRDEIIRTAMKGGGPCGAVQMALELQSAIARAVCWRQASKGISA